MSTKLLRALSLAAGLLLPLGIVASTQTAQAQGADDKEKAKTEYKNGTTKYNLGEWQKAIVHFKAAFEAYPDASFLFNIAQSYRQFGDCKQGAFFYTRYLAIKPDASNKREVDGFIKTLNAECKRKEEAGISTTPPPPDTTKDPVEMTGSGTDTGTGTEAGSGTDTATGDGTQVADSGTGNDVNTSVPGGGEVGDTYLPDSGPTLLVAYVDLGTAIISLGDLGTSSYFNFSVGVGYPLRFGKITVDGGVLFSSAFVPWEENVTMNPESGTAIFSTALANVGASTEVANKIRVRGELGAGLMIYSGLDKKGNPFVEEEFMTKGGALSSAAFRVAVSGEYELTDNLSVNLPIVYTNAPAPSDLAIDSISSIQAMVGVGYRM